MANYLVYLKKHRIGIIVCTFGVLFEALCEVIQPALMAEIISGGIAKGNMRKVLIFGGYMLFVALFGALFASIRNVASSEVSQRFGGEVRRDMFFNVIHLPAEKTDELGTSSIVNRLTNDVGQVTELLNKTMRIAVKAPAVCLGSIVMSCFLSGALAAVFLVSSVCAFIVLFMCMKMGYRRFYKVQTAIDRIATVLEEYLRGVRLVKSFGQFEFEEKRFEKANESLYQLSLSAQQILSVYTPFITLSIYYGIAAVLLFGSRGVTNGTLSVGSIAAFISYMLIMLTSLTGISNVASTYARSRASIERISEILAQPTELNRGTDAQIPQNADVKFENVVFSYPNASGEPVLKNLTFTCETGKTMAIIGSTGAGKSTILNLMLGFYSDYQGSILIGGIDIKTLSRKSLRKCIGIAPQKSMLFSGSIASNLRWGRENADKIEIEEAVKTAQAEEFIKSRKDGYQSVLTQGAANLSGGQKQRLSIARALIKKPSVLLFDDATGALDVLTERSVLEALKAKFGDTTQIIITQRISVAKQADTILVLENGEAAGVGAHEDLLKSCMPYRDICASQLGKQVTV